MIKLVAFDWNGTILSDTNASVKANSAVLVHYGLKPMTLKEFQKNFSVPLRLFWSRMKLDQKIYDRDADKIPQIFFKNYKPLEKMCRSRSGARESLIWLQSNKIKSVIFSNHPIHLINVQLNRLLIKQYFTKILALDLTKERVPTHRRGKVYKLLSYAKINHLKPHEVMVVGDTDEEVEVGKKFGYYTAALTGGWQSTARLKATKPDFLIHNLKDLKKIIQKLITYD